MTDSRNAQPLSICWSNAFSFCHPVWPWTAGHGLRHPPKRSLPPSPVSLAVPPPPKPTSRLQGALCAPVQVRTWQGNRVLGGQCHVSSGQWSNTALKAELHPFIPFSNRQCDNHGAGRTPAATTATLGVGAGPPLPPPASCRSKQHRGCASRPSGPRAEVRTVALSGTALACRQERFLLAPSMLAAGGTTAAVGCSRGLPCDQSGRPSSERRWPPACGADKALPLKFAAAVAHCCSE